MDEAGAKSPPPEFFDDPLPCEVAHGVEEEKKGREAALLAAGGPVAPVEPTPAHGWRVVANGGVRRRRYNVSGQVSASVGGARRFGKTNLGLTI